MATASATKVRIAAIRSVPECAASESRPRLFVAIPATSLTPISTHAATIETRAVRRCGLTTRKDHTMQGADLAAPTMKAGRALLVLPFNARAGLASQVAFSPNRAKGPPERALQGDGKSRCYALAMSPRNRSFRNVPAPWPLSNQWRNFSDWCLKPVYSKSNLQAGELTSH